MHKFLHQQNIERFHQQLTQAVDDRQRETLRTLLAEGEEGNRRRGESGRRGQPG